MKYHSDSNAGLSLQTDEGMEQLCLNIAAVCPSTHALGPGNRAVVWVQGCPFHCAGCISPDWIPQKTATLYLPSQLAKVILSSPELTGITISGGEPMLQAAGLVKMIRLIKQQRDVDVICFTGFQYRNLCRFPENNAIHDLLSLVDVLIDGPYIQKLHTDKGLRGSENQNIIHLTGRLKHINLESQPRNIELLISPQHILMVGIPTTQMKAHQLINQMATLGRQKESVNEWT